MYKLILLSMAVACHFFNSNLNAGTLEDVMDREDKIDHFSSLPAEIKAHIFSLCVPEQKISHRRVCKDWHDHLDQGLSAFFQQPEIKLDYCFYRDFGNLKDRLLEDKKWKTYKFSIIQSQIFYFKNIWQTIASTVVSLYCDYDFAYGNSCIKEFQNIKVFQNLESLEMQDLLYLSPLDITSKRFPKLKKLKLINVKNLNFLPSTFDDCFKNLTDLILIFNRDAKLVLNISGSSCHYLLDLNIIGQKCPNLTFLKLSFIHISPDSIISIFQLRFLEKLALQHCDINDEFAIQLSHAPLEKLQSLNLKYNNIGSSGMQALINRFHHLSKLLLTMNKGFNNNVRQWLLRARWPHSWQSYNNRYFIAFAGAGLSLFVQPNNDGDPADSRDVLPDLDGLS